MTGNYRRISKIATRQHPPLEPNTPKPIVAAHARQKDNVQQPRDFVTGQECLNCG